MTIKPIFAWYDLWVGAFWDQAKRRLYIFPLPMLGVVIQFAAREFVSPPPSYRDLATCAITEARDRLRARGLEVQRLELTIKDQVLLWSGTRLVSPTEWLKFPIEEAQRSAVVGRHRCGRYECVPWTREYLWAEPEA